MNGDVSQLDTVEFDNSYARDLDGLYVEWRPARAPAPSLALFNATLARDVTPALIGRSPDDLAAVFSGNAMPAGAHPLAQAYAGHQFGGLSPQLGDGRALLLGEVISDSGMRYDIQLKGSGRTPFSRNGDGKAALGPMLREYLISEAMHALGIPTTRSLAVVTTGEDVVRDRKLPGAVLTRIASSHIRVGTFEFFAVRDDVEKVRRLADYSIARHYPDLANVSDRYFQFFEAVADKQAALIAKWMLVGFVHGVMNTDNVAISGETIDYGPCAFLDYYDPGAVFSSIDRAGRYAFGQQPVIGQWNLARFAEALGSLIDDDPAIATRRLTNSLNTFPGRYLEYWLKGMRAKLGLMAEHDDDLDLVNALYDAMRGQDVDFTLFFRRMSSALRGDARAVRELFREPARIDDWLTRYERRQSLEALSVAHRSVAMDRVNPLYIPRNHIVEEVLAAAVDDRDYAPFKRFSTLLEHPYTESSGFDRFAAPPPAGSNRCVTFCGT